jgi:hypothetical protein
MKSCPARQAFLRVRERRRAERIFSKTRVETAMLRLLTITAGLLLSSMAMGAAPIAWQDYDNSKFGYGIELPLGMFTGARDGEAGIILNENDGQGQIRVYGAVNAGNLTPGELEEILSDADLVREVTYGRRGSSWFVISGYAAGDDGEDVIFYTKVMFSPDRQVLSAFEARYPVSARLLYDSIIERMEDSLTAPR